jgi:hypothetical protein
LYVAAEQQKRSWLTGSVAKLLLERTTHVDSGTLEVTFLKISLLLCTVAGPPGSVGSWIVLRGTGFPSHCSLDHGSAVRPAVLYFFIDNRNQLHFNQLRALAAILSEEPVLG